MKFQDFLKLAQFALVVMIVYPQTNEDRVLLKGMVHWEVPVDQAFEVLAHPEAWSGWRMYDPVTDDVTPTSGWSIEINHEADEAASDDDGDDLVVRIITAQPEGPIVYDLAQGASVRRGFLLEIHLVPNGDEVNLHWRATMEITAVQKPFSRWADWNRLGEDHIFAIFDRAEDSFQTPYDG
jgi:hypothetical protein